MLAGRGWLVVNRLRQSCIPVESPDLRDATVELASGLGLRNVPELISGPIVSRPMLVGALRPAILLPIEMLGETRSAVAVRSVLAHELATSAVETYCGAAWPGWCGRCSSSTLSSGLRTARPSLLAKSPAMPWPCRLQACGRRSTDGSSWTSPPADRSGPPRWTATIGMVGSTGFLKRRLLAMKTTQQPSHRRLLSWAFALLAVGVAGVIPWQLVSREALGQDPPAFQPATEPTRKGKAHEGTAPA